MRWFKRRKGGTPSRVRWVLEFDGAPLMSAVADAFTIRRDDGPARRVYPGEWLTWDAVPGLVARYEAVGAEGGPA